MEQHKISGVPITVNGYLQGHLTRRDLRFLTDNNQRLSRGDDARTTWSRPRKIRRLKRLNGF